ncbi:Molybdopterin molybdenumtransferase [subsurface metagenome]
MQLCAQTAAVGGRYKNYGIVPDEPKELKAVISEALVECDVVLVSGGVSMGEFDFVPEVLKENGVQIRFHKLAVKPGKPTLFGRKDETFVFGLPGNPVSTFVIFEVFVKTLLYRWMGINYDPVLIKARLSKAIKRRDSERLEFRLVKVAGGEIHPISYHGSSHLNALSQTNGLLRIERGVDFVEEGRELYVRQI